MKADRFYKILSIILVVMNLVLVGFILLPKHPPHHPPKPLKDIVVAELEFDEEQKKQFLASVKRHRDAMKTIESKRRAALEECFASVSGTSGDSIPQGAVEAGKLEQERVVITLEHLKELRSICKEDQLLNFDLLMDKDLKRLLVGDKKRPGPPHRPH